MVIALETWLSSGDHPKQAVRVEETVVVKKDGYELLTSWPIEEVTEAWR
jgi:Xaa-Pro aminopeptidase